MVSFWPAIHATAEFPAAAWERHALKVIFAIFAFDWVVLQPSGRGFSFAFTHRMRFLFIVECGCFCVPYFVFAVFCVQCVIV